MLYIAIVSTFLCIAVLLVGRYEYVHHCVVGGRVRRRLDRMLVRIGFLLQQQSRIAIDVIQRDFIAKALHIISYVALLSVRYVERRLARLNDILRSFRKKRSHPRKPRLHAVRRSGDGA